MRGNGVGDDELTAGVAAKAFEDAARHAQAPLALLAQNFKLSRLANLNAGLEGVDGEADRPEPPAKIPGEIEKAQMQARRGGDLNAFQLERLAARSVSPFAARAIGLEHCETFSSLPSADTDKTQCAALLRGPVQNATLAQSRDKTVRLKAGGR